MSDTYFHKMLEEFTGHAYSSGEKFLPARYVFVLTNLCNLKCSFCFQQKKRLREAMSQNDWINVIGQLPEYSRITLTGGEPLIFSGFKEVFAKIADTFDCNIITNGILLSEEMIDYILSFSKFRVLSISIDDIGNTARGVTPRQWTHLEKMIRYFHQRREAIDSKCIFDVKTMILDENARHLYDIRKYCSDTLKCDTQSFQFLKGSDIQHADNPFSFTEILKKSEAYKYRHFEVIVEQLLKIQGHRAPNQSKVFLHPKFIDLLANVKNEPADFELYNAITHDSSLYEKCMFPWSSLHINYDGAVFPCLNLNMGNVKNQTLKNIIHGARYDEFKNLIKKRGTIQACNRCGWLRKMS